jgi:hypothetical protein
MRNTTQVDRKPTAAQARWITEALDNGEYRMNIPERSRQIMIAAGWMVERATPDRYYASADFVTDDARMAVGRADTVTIPDVKPGDVLVYRTHPGCAFRVTEVITNKYGQAFRGTTLSVCANESGTRVGRDEHTAEFDVQAYQVRPETSDELLARCEAEALAEAETSANIEHSRWLAEQAAQSPVALAAARTGSVGARTLIGRRECAEVAEGQVLAAVAQAQRAAGCPPLCDASAVLHIVPAGLPTDRYRRVAWLDTYGPVRTRIPGANIPTGAAGYLP